MIPSIDEIDIAEKRVFIRTDLDVPLTQKGEIEDDSKILRAVQTIRYALNQRAKVIVASHLGRPGGKFARELSLEVVGARLSDMLDCRIYFPENSIGSAVKKISSDMLPGELMLLENLDFHKKELNAGPEYAKTLSECADIFVNEAFSITNQKRASVNVLPEFFDTVTIGFDFKRELLGLDKLIKPEKPFIVIIGGSSVSRKIAFMEAMIDRVDGFLVGGAVANTFLKAKGIATALSELDQSCLYRAKKLMSGAAIRNIDLILPKDVVAAEGNLRNHGTSYIISRESVPGDSIIMDIGAETLKEFKARIEDANTVLWNGPPGVFEKSEFRKGSSELAKALSESTAYKGAVGDHTASMLTDLGIEERAGDSKGDIDFISHGGEAALEYIENGTLPGIRALEQQIK